MDQVRITIAAQTMEGTAAADPEVMVTIEKLDPGTQQRTTIGTTRIADFSGSVTLTVNAPQNSNPTWMVTATFSRYMAVGGLMFHPNAEPVKRFDVSLVRMPGDWKARFMRLGDLLSPRYDRLRAVAAISRQVDLKLKGAQPVGDLNAAFDTIDGGPQELAKTALLNLYSVLSDETDPMVADSVPWFSYVQKIVRMDQERFIAEADKTIFDHVEQMIADLNAPVLQGQYSTEPASDSKLHLPNIPPQYNCPVDNPVNLDKMITVKKRYEQGDFQLTVSRLKTGQYLLDCDMDEHLNIAGHTVDLVIHAEEDIASPQTAGTHPFLMHEYIVRHSAQAAADGIATVDLGYTLV